VWFLYFQQICWAFLAFFSVGLLGCCFVYIKAYLLYTASMCMYLWSARLMVVSFLLCWTVRPASLFFHLLFNQPTKALVARSLYWKLFLLCFLPLWWLLNLCFRFPSLFIWPIHVAIYICSFLGLPFLFWSFIYLCLHCHQIYITFSQ